VVWNTKEATRLGGANHFIIDLTLLSPNVELNWYIVREDVVAVCVLRARVKGLKSRV
jgi:hypothetical protein